MSDERGLELDEHPQFTEQLWSMQRWILPLLVLLLVLALLGVFGYGMIGRGEVGEPGEPLWLTYDSIAQVQAPTVLTAHIAAAAGEHFELWIDPAFLDAAQINRIQPEPADTTFGPERVIYRFRTQEDAGEAAVHFRYTPMKSGTIDMRIGIVDGPERSFSIFVYP